MRLRPFLASAMMAASVISLFASGCGDKGKFDDFSDVTVPESYIRQKAEASAAPGNSSTDGARTEPRPPEAGHPGSRPSGAMAKNRESGSVSALKNKGEGVFGSWSGKSGSIPERLFTSGPVNPSIASGYAAACEYIRKGETEIGIEKLKHLATMTYAEPEICSQIYFVIADAYEKTGNIREANDFFDKFNDNLKKHRESKPVQTLASNFSRRDIILKKFYPPPGDFREDEDADSNSQNDSADGSDSSMKPDLADDGEDDTGTDGRSADSGDDQ